MRRSGAVAGVLHAERAALAAHCAAAHGRAGRAPHVCPACFRACDSPELLSAHLLRHRQAKQFVCGYDGCILRFATRSRALSLWIAPSISILLLLYIHFGFC